MENYRARLKVLKHEKSLFEDGREFGKHEGMEIGELFGRIHLCQQLLKQPLTPRENLTALSLKELQAMAESLQKQLETLSK